MFLEVFAAPFHLDEHAVGPEEISELLAAATRRFGFVLRGGSAGEEFELGAARLLGDAELQGGPGPLEAIEVAEGAEKTVEKKLRFALLIAAERPGVGSEVREGRFDGVRGERQAAI